MIQGVLQKNGQEITIRFIEELGSSYGQRDVYIAKGSDDEVYEPRFTWHAFRTIEISGLTQELTNEEIDIVVVNTDVSPAGNFNCSNDLFNKIQENYNLNLINIELNFIPRIQKTRCPLAHHF